MDYYKLIGLKKEPFSNSPDPDFFFNSGLHQKCLQKLEIAIRLKRGLNIVTGAVGAGKTTICRELLRKLSIDPEIKTYLILDPQFENANQFLSYLIELFLNKKLNKKLSQLRMKEIIKNFLFISGVNRKQTSVLFIDEGQKIPLFCLELLREFLNYETNSEKLLQIIIFSQLEINETIKHQKNFLDRINLNFKLNPLDYRETKEFICFRLKKAGSGKQKIFKTSGMKEIFSHTGGHPRKIINTCHTLLIDMLIQGNRSINRSFVKSVLNDSLKGKSIFNREKKITGLVIILMITAFLAGLYLSLDDINKKGLIDYLKTVVFKI